MNLYQRLLTLTDEAITTLRTIQETQAVALRAHVAAQRASEASESAAIFRNADAVENLTKTVGDVSRTDPRMRGRLVSVMLDECEDLEALEQAHVAHMKSREGLSLATQIAKLTARGKSGAAEMLREQAETVQPVGFASLSTAAVMCWCAYLIDTTDEAPMTLREWLNGRGKS